MFMGIEYTQRAGVTGVKTVVCEGCGTRYMYQMSRDAEARDCAPYGLGRERAARNAYLKAAAAAQKLFERGCELVPCPECGQYQSEMVCAARSDRHRWMKALGGGLLIFALVPALLAFIMTTAQHQQQFRALPLLFWLAAGALGGLGLMLRVGRKMLADRFDPNATDVDLRKQLGRELTVDPANGAGASPDAVAVQFSRG